jgi:tryptophanyl-tRNA synthetase
LGAVDPLVQLQDSGANPLVFVADLHGLTDHEPEEIKQYSKSVVVDYLALGVDPERAKIFVQSEIRNELSLLTMYLLRHITVSELLRIPTLKDKLKSGSKPENANGLLAVYPVLMASDILIQRATTVPVGKDQLPHLEVTRNLAEKFNDKYGEVFPLPKSQEIPSIKIKSLSGSGKMSKSEPEGAIFLTDSREDIERKFKKAKTDFAGSMNEDLENLFIIAKGLTKIDSETQAIDELKESHMSGKNVMKDFKLLLINITTRFLENYQLKRAEILKKSGYIDDLLMEGSTFAKMNAGENLKIIESLLWK